jgi:hypothetical protein
MKLNELLENNVYSHFDVSNPTLTGSNLKVLTPFFNEIEEFKGKNIEVIESDDNLVTVIGTDFLQENIKLQSVFLLNGDIHIRCTKDSLK